jgi:hypothetical protein
MDDPTRDPPFPDACRIGRAFIPPCCTAITREFLVDGMLYLAFHVTGHGWFPPRHGRIEDINDTGTLVDADGTERRIRWRSDREPQFVPGAEGGS